jgi:hypothetical protein
MDKLHMIFIINLSHVKFVMRTMKWKNLSLAWMIKGPPILEFLEENKNLNL